MEYLTMGLYLLLALLSVIGLLTVFAFLLPGSSLKSRKEKNINFELETNKGVFKGRLRFWS